jgi:hypothetical protein
VSLTGGGSGPESAPELESIVALASVEASLAPAASATETLLGASLVGSLPLPSIVASDAADVASRAYDVAPSRR